jgi:glucan phosphoethanolaminetransferase (alkaline phosphatase superfamily)
MNSATSSQLSKTLLSVALGALVLGCSDEAAKPRQPLYNVILISIDTLRADHVGAYGYERPTTPAVDAFAADSVVFTETIAQAPSTLHSHA